MHGSVAYQAPFGDRIARGIPCGAGATPSGALRGRRDSATRAKVGTFSPRRFAKWQEPAQFPVSVSRRLEPPKTWGNVALKGGSTPAATFCDHLFRTLCLDGQVHRTSCDLPIFLYFFNVLLGEQGSAHSSSDVCDGLTATTIHRLSTPSTVNKTKGWAGCTHLEFAPLLGCSARWAHVATPRVNRRCMAQGLGSLDRLCWMATWLRAPRSARLPMSSIARKTQASADRAALITRPRRGSLYIMRNAGRGLRAAGGVLRCETPNQRTADV